MFNLATISDLVSLPPHTLYNRDIDNIRDRINSKYADRVIPHLGHCLCVYDILNYSDGRVGAGTGNVNINVEFRIIVFRPFKGEIITGVIKKCTPDGLQISLQFFDDISVPQRMLFEGTVYEEEKDEDEEDDGGEEEENGEKKKTKKEIKGTWVWRSEDAELWFDQGTVVNVRVEAEKWGGGQDGDKGAITTAAGAAGAAGAAEDGSSSGSVSYAIEASITEGGLGGLDWW